MTPARFWYDLAVSMRDDAAEAYFLSCANIQAMDVIEELERTLLAPAVTIGIRGDMNVVKPAHDVTSTVSLASLAAGPAPSEVEGA